MIDDDQLYVSPATSLNESREDWEARRHLWHAGDCRHRMREQPRPGSSPRMVSGYAAMIQRCKQYNAEFDENAAAYADARAVSHEQLDAFLKAMP